MSRALQKYLDHVMIYANRRPDEAAKIRLELEDHLKQKITELARHITAFSLGGIGSIRASLEAGKDRSDI